MVDPRSMAIADRDNMAVGIRHRPVSNYQANKYDNNRAPTKFVFLQPRAAFTHAASVPPSRFPRSTEPLQQQTKSSRQGMKEALELRGRPLCSLNFFGDERRRSMAKAAPPCSESSLKTGEQKTKSSPGHVCKRSGWHRGPTATKLL